MGDFSLVVRGTHLENVGAARGKEPLPQQRKKAYRWPTLRNTASKQ
jgi:hypothetical protein